jgi:RHS repeat-associated protein
VPGAAGSPPSGPDQVQCFQYDYLGRLSQAWSQGSSSCSAGPSQSAEAGAAAPYWEQYGYDAQDNMTREVSTPASGSATTVTSGFTPGTHQLASQSSVTGTGTAASTAFGWDAAGNMTSVAAPGGTETLSWGDDGNLASAAATGGTDPGTTGYVYDAGGTLIEQDGPAAKTLFLPWEELTVTTISGKSTVSGTRYYSFGGAAIAARTSAGNVYYLGGDQEGTSTLAIDSASLAPAYRYYDPYGSQAGTPPSSWPGLRGFQGGTADPDTGLENIGAREYDPGTAAFTSPDPLLNPADPQDLNPYAYAQDGPPSLEDPSGQATIEGFNCNGLADCLKTGDSDSPGSGSSSPGHGKKSSGHSDSSPGLGPSNTTGQCNILGEHCSLPAPPLPRPVVHKITDDSAPSRNVCTGANDIRLGIEPTCRPQTPTGSFNLVGWIERHTPFDRAPDYISVNLTSSLPFVPIIYGGANFTFTRNGKVFVGPQGGIGIPGAMIDARPGWINQRRRPSQDEVNGFVSGWSVGASAYAAAIDGITGPSAAETWGNVGQHGWNNFATEIGWGVGVGHSVSIGGGYDFSTSWPAPSW